MSDNKIIIGDKMIEEQLEEKSAKLNISLEGLVDRYIRRGLFMDDYYDLPKLTIDDLIEMSKKDLEKDMKRGIPPKKYNSDVFVGIMNNSDD